MKRRLWWAVCLVSVFVVLAVMVLPGCGGDGGDGGGDGEVNTVNWGWIYDFTGRAATAVKPMYDGARDFLHYAAETGQIPDGIEIKMDTFDTQGDSGKVPGGYVYLRDRGMDVLEIAAYQYELILDQSRTDGVPSLNTHNQLNQLGLDTQISLYGANEHAQELVLNYIMNTWDYSGGLPKVGMVLYSGVSNYEVRRDFDAAYCAEHADKLNWIGAQAAPIGTTVWAAQVERLKDADYVIPVVSGAPLANFVKEMQGAGFDGVFIHDQDLLGHWSQVLAQVDKDYLDGTIVVCWLQWWSETTEWMTTMKEYSQKYNTAPEYAGYKLGSGYQTGWGAAEALLEAVRIAIQDVGAANVDGPALMESMMKIDLEVPGYGNTWKVAEGYHQLIHGCVAYEYRVADGDFMRASDFMVIPEIEAFE